MTNAPSNAKLITRRLRKLAKEDPAAWEVIACLRDAIPDTVLFGGMIRDLCLQHRWSDIDLVSNESRHALARVLEPYRPRTNRFGGFRFLVGRQYFDVWALEDTWALKHELVKPAKFAALLRSTFFHVDASFYHLTTKQFLQSEEQEASIERMVLSINLEENPNPRNMALKAIQHALTRNFSLSHGLADFVVRTLGSTRSHLSPMEVAVHRQLSEQLDSGADRLRLDLGTLQTPLSH